MRTAHLRGALRRQPQPAAPSYPQHKRIDDPILLSLQRGRIPGLQSKRKYEEVVPVDWAVRAARVGIGYIDNFR